MLFLLLVVLALVVVKLFFSLVVVDRDVGSTGTFILVVKDSGVVGGDDNLGCFVMVRNEEDEPPFVIRLRGLRGLLLALSLFGSWLNCRWL